MPDPSLLGGLVRCVGCGASSWRAAPGGVDCTACGFHLAEDQGVLRVAGLPPDEVAQYYDFTGGPHFVGTSFADNMQIHFSTQAYRRHLDELLSPPRGAFVDLGCGDGRLSLWGLERGFPAVVAMDSSLAPLKRLVAAAGEGGRSRLVAVQASFRDACLVPGAFHAALAVEAFTYLEDYGAGLALLRGLLAPDGRALLSEFGRVGRLLSDVIAINVENMTKVAAEGRRWEKFAGRRLAQRLFRVRELVDECERAGLSVLERRGISPIPMLFQYVHSLTSYPLRPALDSGLEGLIAQLDAQASELSDSSRNIVLLLGAAR